MFIQDQTNKILFNMLYYKIQKIDNRIVIYDKNDTLLGSLVEYKDSAVTQIILGEIIRLMKHCNMNKIFCVYKFPIEEHVKLSMSEGAAKPV